MRASGWVRVWIVFAVIMWGFGVSGLLGDGAPPVLPPSTPSPECHGDFWCALTVGSGAAGWRLDWSTWMAEHVGAVIWVVARPVAFALGVLLVWFTLGWVVRGFFPKERSPATPAPSLRQPPAAPRAAE